MGIQHKVDDIIAHLSDFGLLAPASITFGSDCLKKAATTALKPYRGKKALLVLGRRSARRNGVMDSLSQMLSSLNIESIPFAGVNREPTPAIVDEGAAFARSNAPDIIIAAGGGSVIDTAKAIAALLTNPGTVEDYLEGVGAGKTLENAPCPLIAIPTTAGTGAEMTKNAVICSPDKQYKRSMRDDRMIPDVAIIDPALTQQVSAEQTAMGGMDTITQLIEVCITKKQNHMATQFATAALRKTAAALERACQRPENRPAREQLAYASFISGVCLANSGLAMTHGIAAGLGALIDMPHGFACGILLPHMIKYNENAAKFELQQALAALLNLDFPDDKVFTNGIRLIKRLNHELGIPPNLKYLYLKDSDIHLLAEKSMGSSMAGNPIEMTPDSLYTFLKDLC